MVKIQKYLFILLVWIISPFINKRVEAELTIHVKHPWASDTARLNYGLFVIHSGNWYPGDEMNRAGGDWFTFTFPNADSSKNERFELVSYKSTQYVERDSMVKYTGGTQQLIFKNILKEIPEATEIWLFIDDLSGFPRILTQPPESKVINFFNPWKIGAPRARLKGSVGSITTSSIKLRGVPDLCGWVRYYHLDSSASPLLQIISSADTTLFYGASGLGDTNYIDFSGLFEFTDTIWVLPDPYPEGSPSILKKYPGKVADCTPITLAAKIWDIGEQIDFGNNTPVTGCVKGIVQNRLGSNGKPVHNNADSTVKALDKWYNTQTFPGGYTNETCHNITLTKNDDGLYEYATNEFFPVDDFLYLDDAETVRNPNWTGEPGQSNHNYHFVMEMECEFEYVKGQEFTFRGDDDVWVFIDSQLVVDLGGVHGPWQGSVDLDTLGLKEGATYNFKLFFAERHCCGSNFKIITSIDLRTSSNLFSIKTEHPDNSVQYDLFEKITQNTNTCDVFGDIVDTVKATVNFYITGPGIGSPQHLLSGTHYEGIFINSDYSQITIDTSRINELLPGEYTIKYYSTRNPSQYGQLKFVVTIHEKPPLITHAFYKDINADGTIDHVVLEFDKTVPVSGVKGMFSINNIKFSVSEESKITYSDNNESKVKFSLSSSVPEEMNGITSGIMNAQITFDKFPGVEIVNSVQDSAAPVLVKAFFSEGITELNSNNIAPDTLQVTFSESIQPITVSKPFLFKKSDSDNKSYSLSLDYLEHSGNLYTFIVSEIHGEGYPTAFDSVFIDSDRDINIRDIIGNTQLNPLNRRVLLEIKPIIINFKIIAGPSPFNPNKEKFTIKIKQNVRTKTEITCEISILILDPLGNCIYETYKESTTESSFAWNGFNKNGRITGNGTYLLLAKILNRNSLQYATLKRLFSVKTY